MRYLATIVALMSALIFLSCDGEQKVYIPDPRTNSPIDSLLGKIDSLQAYPKPMFHEEPEQVALENRQLIIDVASVVGGDAPTDVTVKVHFEKGKIASYTVTTSAIKLSKSTKKSNACPPCDYVIQRGDTKTSLEKKFPGIKILNKNLIAGQKLVYE